MVMANLVPRDTFFHDMFDFRRNFDQAFNRLLRWPSASQQELAYQNEFSPTVEAFIDRDNKKFQCEVVLPGVDPKDVDIQVQGNMLTISGERTNTRETRDADFLHREISYGSFTRSLVLPEGVDKEKISAEYRNGMLEITAPIATASLPKKVEIKTLPASRAASA
jgi:HSP20 family protein